MFLLYFNLLREEKTFPDYKPCAGEHGCILCSLVLSRTPNRDVNLLNVELGFISIILENVSIESYTQFQFSDAISILSIN